MFSTAVGAFWLSKSYQKLRIPRPACLRHHGLRSQLAMACLPLVLACIAAWPASCALPCLVSRCLERLNRVLLVLTLKVAFELPNAFLGAVLLLLRGAAGCCCCRSAACCCCLLLLLLACWAAAASGAGAGAGAAAAAAGAAAAAAAAARKQPSSI